MNSCNEVYVSRKRPVTVVYPAGIINRSITVRPRTPAENLTIPAVVLLGTLIAWKKDVAGAAIFLFFAMYYVYVVGLDRHWSWYVSIAGPALLIAILFFLNWLSVGKDI